MARLSAVDQRASEVASLSKRAKQPRAGGEMAAFGSASGAQRSLPQMWSPRSMRSCGVGPVVGGHVADGEYGQILEVGAVVARVLVRVIFVATGRAAQSVVARIEFWGCPGWRFLICVL